MAGDSRTFADRRDAGRQLGRALAGYDFTDPVVLALPRGGVPVGFEVAQALRAPLDVLLVRKIGAPQHPEYGIGAVVDGEEPQLVVDEEAARAVGATPEYLEAEKRRQLDEIERRRALYCGRRPPVAVTDRTAVVVDDGIATGGTVKVALKALQRAGPAWIVLAVPVAPRDSLEAVAEAADAVLCLSAPEDFRAVGLHYTDFAQTSDDEVVRLLEKAAEVVREALWD